MSVTANSQSNAATTPADPMASSGWTAVCNLMDVLPGTGVAALIGDQPVAIFRLSDDCLYALGNIDPFSGASVLSRGIIGDIDGVPVIASPIFKQHFRLDNGQCAEDDAVAVPSYPVSVVDQVVHVQVLDI